MAENIDDLTINWTDEEGNLVVKELKKEVLTRGAWTTIMYAYQEMDRRTGDYGPVKFRVVRYQKRNGRFTPQSKFNISSIKQAGEVVRILSQWLDELE